MRRSKALAGLSPMVYGDLTICVECLIAGAAEQRYIHWVLIVLSFYERLLNCWFISIVVITDHYCGLRAG